MANGFGLDKFRHSGIACRTITQQNYLVPQGNDVLAH